MHRLFADAAIPSHRIDIDTTPSGIHCCDHQGIIRIQDILDALEDHFDTLFMKVIFLSERGEVGNKAFWEDGLCGAVIDENRSKVWLVSDSAVGSQRRETELMAIHCTIDCSE